MSEWLCKLLNGKRKSALQTIIWFGFGWSWAEDTWREWRKGPSLYVVGRMKEMSIFAKNSHVYPYLMMFVQITVIYWFSDGKWIWARKSMICLEYYPSSPFASGVFVCLSTSGCLPTNQTSLFEIEFRLRNIIYICRLADWLLLLPQLVLLLAISAGSCPNDVLKNPERKKTFTRTQEILHLLRNQLTKTDIEEWLTSPCPFSYSFCILASQILGEIDWRQIVSLAPIDSSAN